MGVCGQRHAPALYPRQNDTVPTVQKAEWDPKTVRTSADNLTYNGIRSANGSALRESLHRLSYPGPPEINVEWEFTLEMSRRARFIFVRWKHTDLVDTASG
jgi:hypothetical protein